MGKALTAKLRPCFWHPSLRCPVGIGRTQRRSCFENPPPRRGLARVGCRGGQSHCSNLAVRRAIDHGRDGPSLIRTIHGRGYLFAGGVTQEIVTPSPPAVSSPERLLSVGKRLGDGPGKLAVDLSRYPRTLKAAEDTDSDEERPERWMSERRQLTILTCEVVELAISPPNSISRIYVR